MRRLSLSSSTLLIVAAGCAPTHQPTPASIPAPLVTALLDERGLPTRATPAYSVGEVPATYPRALIPSGPVTIVGGMTMGDDATAVFADSTRRLAAVMEQLFEQHGYVRPLPTPGSGFSWGSGPYSYFCGDSALVSVTPLAGVSPGSVRVLYRRVRGRASCPAYQRTRSSDGLTLPELKPPPGVHVARGQSGSGGGVVNSTAEVTGVDLSASAVVAHYGAQLVGAGWKADPPAIGERVTVQYFTAVDTTGHPWQGVLMAEGGKTVLTVSLTMHQRPDDRHQILLR